MRDQMGYRSNMYTYIHAYMHIHTLFTKPHTQTHTYTHVHTHTHTHTHRAAQPSVTRFKSTSGVFPTAQVTSSAITILTVHNVSTPDLKDRLRVRARRHELCIREFARVATNSASWPTGPCVRLLRVGTVGAARRVQIGIAWMLTSGSHANAPRNTMRVLMRLAMSTGTPKKSTLHPWRLGPIGSSRQSGKVLYVYRRGCVQSCATTHVSSLHP